MRKLRRLRRAIRDSRLLAYEETGHAPHWEQPERFVADLVEFIGAPAPIRRRSLGASPA